jgi:hypothetical protein
LGKQVKSEQKRKKRLVKAAKSLSVQDLQEVLAAKTRVGTSAWGARE